MAPRALGALLAVVAALALALALAGGTVPKVIPGWWDGHPTVNGDTIKRKDVHVGLLGAEGCDLGETVECRALPTGGRLELIGIAELAALGLGIATALVLARSVWKIGDHRKLLGKLVLVELVLVAGGGAAIFILGPDLKAGSHIAVPLGLGMFGAIGGVATGALASVIAIRLEPEPLRLKTSMSRMPAPAFDVRDLVRQDHDGLRPARGTDRPVASPDGAGAHAPALFDAAPQLRPLYDVANAGVVPAPSAPPLPERAPTPMSRDAVGALVGIPTPPPLDAVTPLPPRTSSVISPFADTPFDETPHSPTAPQDAMPSGMIDAQRVSRAISNAGRAPTPPVAPPAPPPPIAPPVPGSRTAIGAAVVGGPRSRPSVPPPLVRPPLPRAPGRTTSPPPTPKNPTIAHAIPPPPKSDNPIAPTVLPARDSQVRLKTDAEGQPTRVRDAVDPITAVELDAEAKANAKVGDERTDLNIAAVPDGADLTDESLVAPPTRRSFTAPGVDGTDEQPIAPPVADERPSEVNLTVPRPRESIGSSTLVVPAPEELPPPALDPAKVPISTAPASLPPPKKASAAMTTGPTPACPQCEAPMAWVEEHLRFYCAQCRMYF